MFHDVSSFVLQQPIATLVINDREGRENVNMSILSNFYTCASVHKLLIIQCKFNTSAIFVLHSRHTLVLKN